MADAKDTPKDTPVVKVDQAEGDRVAMLSLRVDGSPDQTNPTIVGDKDQAIAAAKEQFAQKAVSAADAGVRAEHGLAPTDDGDTADAQIDAVKADLDKVAATAEKAAEKVVNDLHEG